MFENFKIEPKDIIAIILVAGGLWLISKGTNGVVAMILIAIVAYYYGIHIPYNGWKNKK